MHPFLRRVKQINDNSFRASESFRTFSHFFVFIFSTCNVQHIYSYATWIASSTLTSYLYRKHDNNNNNNHIITFFFLISTDASKAHVNLFSSNRNNIIINAIQTIYLLKAIIEVTFVIACILQHIQPSLLKLFTCILHMYNPYFYCYSIANNVTWFI